MVLVKRMQQGFFLGSTNSVAPAAVKGKIIKSPCNTCHGSGVADRQKRQSLFLPEVDNGDRVRLTGKR